jgi:hypothetical protein
VKSHSAVPATQQTACSRYNGHMSSAIMRISFIKASESA